MKTVLIPLCCLALAAQSQDDPNLGVFTSAIQRLVSKDKNLAVDLDEKGAIYSKAMTLDPNTATLPTRLTVARWLLLRNTAIGFRYSGKTSYLQASGKQPDLQKAFSLIDGLDTSASAREINQLKLEISWRIHDIGGMRTAYDKVSVLDDLDPRELVHCLMVSIHLGEWEAAVRFARVAQGRKMDLRGFHQAALNNLTSFDYESVIRALNQEHPIKENANLGLRSYEIIKWRCRPKELTGADSKILDPLSAQMKGMMGKWIDHAPAQVMMLQVGASIHWLESSVQEPVSGFKEASRIYLVGYQEPMNSPSGPMRQQDVWDMKLDLVKPGVWTGVNIMTSRPVGASEGTAPSIQLIMEHEFQLKVVEDYTSSNSR